MKSLNFKENLALFCIFLCLTVLSGFGCICSPHSVHRAHAGESEKILREAFSEASSHAKLGKPSVIFLDEIDALCPRRDSRYMLHHFIHIHMKMTLLKLWFTKPKKKKKMLVG